MTKQPPRFQDRPVRILVLEKYVETMRSLLTVPHELFAYDQETDRSMADKLLDIDVMISSAVKGKWLGPAATLKLVQGVGAGIEGIELDHLPPGCMVCNVYGHEWAVAEYCFMTMAMLNREVIQQDAALRCGDWSGGVFRHELRGGRLLLLGLGHIGTEVARWGRFYGMTVSGLTRNPAPARGQSLGLDYIGPLSDLAQQLPQADFVVVAIPHVPETVGFIDQAAFERMKSTAILVNVARGPVVDENALYEALHQQTIAGAAIDVWYNYPAHLDVHCPPANTPLHELSNTIMTPHNAGTTHGTMNYRFAFIAENIGRFVRGQALQNVVYNGHS